MRLLLFLLIAASLHSASLFAQNAGDFRSFTSGSWTSTNTWESFNGVTWSHPSVGIPNASSGIVTIQSGHTVTVPASTTVNGGAGLEVYGTLTNFNAAIVNGTTTFRSGSRYRHQHTTVEGVVPLATWEPNSTLEIAYVLPNNASISFTNAGNWSQNFYNVEVNSSTGSNRSINASGLLTTIQGNFIITTTGAGSFILQSSNNTSRTLTIAGSFTLTSGILNLANANNALTTLNIGGNFTLAGGSIDRSTNASTPVINFNGSLQNYTLSGGTFITANNKPYSLIVAASSTVNMSGTTSIAGSVIVNGTLNLMGQSSIAGSCTFTLGSNGILGVGSTNTNGAIQVGAGAGSNLQNTGTRTFSSGSTIEFNGAGLQYTGTGYPSTSAGVNVLVNNNTGVDISGNITVTGNVILQAGNLNVGPVETLTLNGNFSGSHNITVTPTSSLVINGSGNFGTFPFPAGDQTFSNFTLNRTGGSVIFGNNVTIGGTTTLSAGTLNFQNVTLTVNDAFSAAAGNLFANGNSNLIIGGGGTFGTLQFAAGGNTLNTLTINRAGQTISLGGNLTITGAMNLNNGSFSVGTAAIRMEGTAWNANGATFLSTGVVNFVGNTVIGGNVPPTFYNIGIRSGSSVDFPPGEIHIGNNAIFEPDANLNHNNGTVVFNGVGNQLFNGGNKTFYNVTVNKTSGNIISGVGSGTINLISILDIQSASQFSSNGNLVLLSSGDEPDISALINTLPVGASVTGNVEVQRFISGGEGRVYRYISSPVQGATVADWKDDFVITGTFSDPSTADPLTGETTICGLAIRPSSPSLFYYDEPSASYIAYPSSGLASANPIERGRGYATFIRQCDVPTLIRVSGPVNQGDIPLPVSHINPDESNFSFSLVGNPYPAPLLWREHGNGWSKNNIGAIVAIRDNGIGDFVYFDEDDPESIIAIGQGFWVYSTGSAPSLIVTEQGKSDIPNIFYRQAAPQRDRLTIHLSNGQKMDKTYFRLKPDATEGLDRNDAWKFDNDTFEIGTFADSEWPLAVNAVGEVSCERNVKLYVNDLAAGDYQINFSTEGIFDAYDISITDHFVAATKVIPAGQSYTFNVTSNPATYASDRFEIQLNRSSLNTEIMVNKGTQAICAETEYEVIIEDAQPYVQYYAMLGNEVVSDKISSHDGASVSVNLNVESLEFGNNNITLMADNSCAIERIGEAFIIKKEGLPEAVAKSEKICQRGSLTLEANGAPSDGTYVWYNSLDDTTPIFTGEAFQTPVLSKTKIYYVAAINSLGCEGNRIPVKAEVIPYDDVVITPTVNQTLQSSYAEGNQWYFNNVPIANGNTQTIRPTKPGWYAVVVTIGECTTRADIDYSHGFRRDIANGEVLQVFPNPITSSNTVSFRVFADYTTDASILNALGHHVGKFTFEKESTISWFGTASFEKLPAGIYYISVNTNEGQVRSKVIKP